jgi:hypothetical protein
MFKGLSETLASVCEQISNPKAYQQKIKNELDKACENALKKAEESEKKYANSNILFL